VPLPLPQIPQKVSMRKIIPKLTNIFKQLIHSMCFLQINKLHKCENLRRKVLLTFLKYAVTKYETAAFPIYKNTQFFFSAKTFREWMAPILFQGSFVCTSLDATSSAEQYSFLKSSCGSAKLD
jgi:hypothetical protein